MREVVPFALGRIADVGLFGVGGLLSFLFYFFFPENVVISYPVKADIS